jgi:hypothetical protein
MRMLGLSSTIDEDGRTFRLYFETVVNQSYWSKAFTELLS